jgi:hypothetical protein
MALWTPEDLTNPAFIKTLSPLDQSNALLTLSQSMAPMQDALARNTAALAEVQNLTNTKYTRRTIKDAEAAAAAAVAAGDPNAAQLTATANELRAKRDELNTQENNLLGYVTSGKDGIFTANTAINNLKDAGVVPPGTNQFTPPAGDTQPISQPSQVSATSSPNPDPTPASKLPANTDVQNDIPATLPDENFGNLGAQPPTDTSPITITSHNDPYVGDAANQPYDDNGQLNPGWQIEDSTGKPFYVGDLPKTPIPEPIKPADDPKAAAAEAATAAPANVTAQGSEFGTDATFAKSAEPATKPNSAVSADSTKQKTAASSTGAFKQNPDWRVRLSLAPSANYLYMAAVAPDILLPLKGTNGVVFPYTPAISMAYKANYDAAELTHSNYKLFFYKSSAVDDISLTADFTAQDTKEANYLLAVIHFFRSVTKMFYGQDGKNNQPKAGTPPPLCYLSGLGAFQFDNHPVAVTNFQYSLPNDVDYIRTGVVTQASGQNTSGYNVKAETYSPPPVTRLSGAGLNAGGVNAPPKFSSLSNSDSTYVPTKMQIVLTLLPIVTRNDISNNFSLQEYATGKLLRGSQRNGGGIW